MNWVLRAITGLIIATSSAQSGTPEENLASQSQQAINAMKDRDFEKYATFVHPQIIEDMGGREAFVDMMKKTMPDMRSEESIRLIDMTVGTPSKIIRDGDKLTAFVPERMVLSIDGNKLNNLAFSVAVSEDGGKRWTLLRGDKFPPTTLRIMFPALCRDVPIPPVRDEVTEYMVRMAQDALKTGGGKRADTKQ